MIQQRIGDLLEIQHEGEFYYVVVLTKIVMFGGNIVFAHHTTGEQMTIDQLHQNISGFNVCTDLLLPKRQNAVKRLHRYTDLSPYWLTQYAKGCNEYRLGEKATRWFIYDIHNLRSMTASFDILPPQYYSAMDRITYGFGSVINMIKSTYTPDQNEHI